MPTLLHSCYFRFPKLLQLIIELNYMFGNEIELVFTNEGYAMNTKGKYFHAKLLTLSVFATLYPTIGSAANIMYQNGGEHNINDLNAPDCLYVQNKTKVNVGGRGGFYTNARVKIGHWRHQMHTILAHSYPSVAS